VLCDTQWIDTLNLLLAGPRCLPKIYGTLSVEPKLRRIAEQAGEAKRHLGADCPTFPDQLIDRLARHTKRPSKTRHGKAVIRQEILAQYLAGMSRPNFTLSHILNTHILHLILVVVRKFYVVGVAVDKPETYAPLVIDGDRILSLPFSFEFVESIAWRNLQVIQTRCQVDIFQLRIARLLISGGKRFDLPFW
jgi:hypothetical protein